MQLFKGVWTEGLSFVRAVGPWPPSLPCRLGLANMASHFIPARSETSTNKTEAASVSALVAQVPAIASTVLSARSRSRGGRYNTGHLGTSRTARCDPSPNWAATPG